MPRRPARMDAWEGVDDADPQELESLRLKLNVPETSSKKKDKNTKHLKRKEKGSTAPSNPAEFKLPDETQYLIEAANGVANLLHHETETLECGDPQMNLRALHDFVIFETGTFKPISLAHLWDIDVPCEAYGWVVPELDHGYEPDDEDGINFRTTTILCVMQEYESNNICIQTQYGFYNLRYPSPLYTKLFLPFYTREMAVRLVIRNVLDKPNISVYELVNRASLLGVDMVLKRPWAQTDFEEKFPALSELRELVAAMQPEVSWERIAKAPLISALCRSKRLGKAPTKPLNEVNTHVKGPSESKRRTSRKKARDTVVTSLVNTIVHEYFDMDFEVVGRKPDYLEETILNRDRPQDSLVESETYDPGDFVIVNRDDKNWIGQVVACPSKKSYHVRWFLHSSETIFGDLGNGQELFLSLDDECTHKIRPHQIMSKCNVVRLTLHDYWHLNWPDKASYFYCFAWHRERPADFTECTDDQVRTGVCITCREREHPISTLLSKDKTTQTAEIRGVKYHEHDFLRYKSGSPAQLTCSIGQVVSFSRGDNEITVTVRQLGRAERIFGKMAELSLVMTNSTETIDAAMVLGKCYVLPRFTYELRGPTWMDRNPDCFYIHLKARTISDTDVEELPINEFKYCEQCLESYERHGDQVNDCKAQRVLEAFDPFIGVDGLGLGLSRGCSMKTVAGIEIDSNTAEAARMNLGKESFIITEDANKVLKQLIEKRKWSDRIQKDKVDILYSGPPCQNDSTLNMYKSDESRPLLTALSYIDHLRPSFVVLEFVPGFFQWKTVKPDRKEVSLDEHKKKKKPEPDDFIQACYLKLVLKVFLLMGYNVRGRLMHARAYGVPQTRDRFFIVASSSEYEPITLPEATHAFNTSPQSAAKQQTIYGGLSLKVDLGTRTALHEVVTIKDALSDLPLFDWDNPRKEGLSQLEIRERHRRKTVKNIPTIPCPQNANSVWGIKQEHFSYKTPPMNSFQRLARSNLVSKDPTELYHLHYTDHFDEKTVQNICDIPIQMGADYRHLPQENLEPSLREPHMAQGRHEFRGGAYARLDPDGYFHTISTNIAPMAKQASVIHPYCRRILTVREWARAQGFPDHFAFYSKNSKIKEYNKQIGNSVPLGVSAAIGRGIQEAVFKKWLAEKKAGLH